MLQPAQRRAEEGLRAELAVVLLRLRCQAGPLPRLDLLPRGQSGNGHPAGDGPHQAPRRAPPAAPARRIHAAVERPDPPDRTHRQRQDHHAQLHDRPDQQRAALQDHRHRGPGRVRPQAEEGRHRPAGAVHRRQELLQRPDPRAPAGPRRHLRRRDARPRNHGDRPDRRRDGPPRHRHLSHRQHPANRGADRVDLPGEQAAPDLYATGQLPPGHPGPAARAGGRQEESPARHRAADHDPAGPQAHSRPATAPADQRHPDGRQTGHAHDGGLPGGAVPGRGHHLRHGHLQLLRSPQPARASPQGDPAERAIERGRDSPAEKVACSSVS